MGTLIQNLIDNYINKIDYDELPSHHIIETLTTIDIKDGEEIRVTIPNSRPLRHIPDDIRNETKLYFGVVYETKLYPINLIDNTIDILFTEDIDQDEQTLWLKKKDIIAIQSAYEVGINKNQPDDHTIEIQERNDGHDWSKFIQNTEQQEISNTLVDAILYRLLSRNSLIIDNLYKTNQEDIIREVKIIKSEIPFIELNEGNLENIREKITHKINILRDKISTKLVEVNDVVKIKKNTQGTIIEENWIIKNTNSDPEKNILNKGTPLAKRLIDSSEKEEFIFDHSTNENEWSLITILEIIKAGD